jgi:WD40 repeat protein
MWHRRVVWGLAVASALFLGILGSWFACRHNRQNHEWLRLSNVATLNKDKGLLVCFAYSRDGKLLACANCWDGLNTICIWEVATGRERTTLTLPRDVWSRDASGGLLNLEKSYQISSLTFSPDGRTLASGGDETIRIWDMRTRKEQINLKNHSSWVTCLAFSPDRTLLAAGDLHAVIIWDVRTGKPRLKLPGPSIGVGLTGLAFSPNGKVLLAAGDGGPIKLWEVATGKEVWSFKAHVTPEGGGGPCCLAFAPDGKTFATAGTEPYVRIWDFAARKEVANYRFDLYPIGSVAFSPDGKLLAATGRGPAKSPGPVNLWDLATGERLGVWRTREYEPHGIAFSPDGKQLAVGCAPPKGYVELWSVKEILAGKGK